MAPPSKPLAATEWRSSWKVVLAAFAGSALASMYAYSLGVTIAPLEREFGWSRAQISSGLLIVSLFSVTLSMPMGMIIDRAGPRRLALVGVVIYCVAVALLSRATASLQVWWALWALIAISIMFIKPTVWVAAITSLFTVHRGMALAVVLSATGFISFLTPIVTLTLAKTFGWRMAYVFLAGGGAIIVLPLVYLFFTSAKDRQRQAPQRIEQQQGVLLGLTVRQGLTSVNFYLLAVAGLAMSLASVAMTINMVPILMFKTFSPETAALGAGLIGVAQVVGRLSGGYFLDRFNARIVAAVAVALPIVTGALLLGFPGSLPAAILAVIFLGLAAGAEMDAVAYLCGKCFGQRNFAALFGAFSGILTLGVGIGPMLGNFVYDRTRSYDPVLWGVMPLALLSALLFLLVRPFPDFEGDAAAV